MAQGYSWYSFWGGVQVHKLRGLRSGIGLITSSGETIFSSRICNNNHYMIWSNESWYSISVVSSGARY